MTTATKHADQHITDFQNQLNASTIRAESGPQLDAAQEAESVSKVDTTDMLRQVTGQIENLQARLSETSGFDEKTGAPRLAIPADDRRRQVMEVQLRNLQHNVLPYTHARAAEIEAKKAQLPTPQQRLQDEGERQQRLAAMAQKRAEEIEVEEMARRLIAQRHGAGHRA